MAWFSKSVKIKLGFVVVLLAAVSAGVGLIATSKLSDMNDRLNTIVDISSTRILHAARIQRDLTAIHREEKNLVLAQTTEIMDSHAQAIADREAEMNERLAELEAIALPEGKQQIQQFRDAYATFKEISGRVRENSRRNTNAQAFDLSSNSGREKFDKAEAQLRTLAQNNEAVVAEISTQMAESADEQGKENLKKLSNATTRALISARMLQDMIALQRAEKNLILANIDEQMDAFAKPIEDLDASIRKRGAELDELVTASGRDELERFEATYAEWLAINERVRSLSREASNRKARLLSSNEGREAFDTAAASMAGIVQSNDESMIADKAASDRNYTVATTLIIASTTIGVIAGVAIAWFIVQQIVTVLMRIVARVKQIAEGDLTGEALPVKGQDELADLTGSVNKMTEELRSMIGRIKATSGEVAGAATQVSGSSEELSSTVQGQNAQLEQVSAAIEELSRSISDVAGNCDQASETARSARDQAQSGGEVVTNTVGQMNQIASTVGATAETVRSLGAQTEQIGEIIEVINEIAEQTNLLALNAAI